LVTNTGKVISFGQNDYGQCGHEDITNPVKVPTVIKSLAQMDSEIKFVATGTCHSIAASSHHVYTFGSGKYGRLGHGNLENKSTPTRVEFFEKLFNGDAARRNYLRVEQVSCACNNSLVLDSSGTVYIMGKYRGEDQMTPIKLAINTRVRFVSGGDFFTGLITSTDELYTFGDDSYGQLGNNVRTYVKEPTRVASLSDVKKICCGSNHMAALTHDGKVYTWGKGEQGRLGFESKLNVYTPKELTIVRKKDIRQMDATSDYILLCNSECLDGYSNGGALGMYQRRNFEELLSLQGKIPFSDVLIYFDE
jgi:alpha-tubulin suppressor-like RCC1 family protein